eukprot:CAMPEP_0115854842 /NCGR_PEP_ID=MMETSP0287-20121206/14234_1 /TAXON_ID=412157 /ORGANISM="Chrysochromulina rotalis, Strain UIO044" /LENGTH=153 /DNA_ID=CAMNT_0003308975 /DNA_START=16 /DNA_END=477 /DNA_ORIENTATION=+
MRVLTAMLATSAMFRRPMIRPTRHFTLRCVCNDTSGPSVSGTIYRAPDNDAPTIQLFTKAGCTLCDVAKEILVGASSEQPHSLEAIDITDPEHAEWWDKYKYDIPVLHINAAYWAKHRITAEEAVEALSTARAGKFEPRRGEPDAGRLERKSK